MASSMNNWLGFSLSPQEQQIPPHHEQQQQLIPEQPHGGGDCFDSTMQMPSLNSLPAHVPFGILEAFKTNHNNHSSSPQDWNWKEVSTNYKNSLLMERSSCNSNNIPSPKLENFLGGRSFSTTDHHQNHNPNSTIGLSMIKNWLRNNPAAQSSQPEESINDQYFNAAAETMNFSGGATTQNLSLSMSTGSQSTAASALPLLTGGGGRGSSDGDNGAGDQMSSSSENKQPPPSSGVGMATVGGGGLDSQSGAIEAVPRKSIDTFGQRTSIYRGVTRHRWTGRYEAHLWDNSCRREGQTRKGRQVYLGGYDKEEKAARAYDLAALKYWGTTTTTNFPISNYEKEVEEMKHMTRQEYVASLRRKSSGFSRGASIYRGVTRHHQHGRWQARIGRVAGNKDLYLGTFSTQEEAAEAYDIAAIKFRGLNAVTNFEINRYDVKSILESSTLPIGGAAKRLKDAEQAAEMLSLDAQRSAEHNNIIASHLAASDHHGILNSYGAASAWPTTTIAFQQQAQPLTMQYHPYGGGGSYQQRLWCKQENDNNSFQDFHQLQVGNTHNFLQPSVLHNLMSLDSASSGENASSYHNQGVGYGTNTIHLPMSSSAVQEEEGKHIEFENNMYVPSSGGIDNEYQNSRNSLYNYHHHLQQQGSWVPTAVPALAARANTIAAVCHASSPFIVWNDT